MNESGDKQRRRKPSSSCYSYWLLLKARTSVLFLNHVINCFTITSSHYPQWPALSSLRPMSMFLFASLFSSSCEVKLDIWNNQAQDPLKNQTGLVWTRSSTVGKVVKSQAEYILPVVWLLPSTRRPPAPTWKNKKDKLCPPFHCSGWCTHPYSLPLLTLPSPPSLSALPINFN